MAANIESWITAAPSDVGTTGFAGSMVGAIKTKLESRIAVGVLGIDSEASIFEMALSDRVIGGGADSALGGPGGCIGFS